MSHHSEPMYVNVRIRHRGYPKAAALLTRCTVDKLDQLRREVMEWGVMYEGDGPYEDAFGQFVVDGADTYFEIVVGSDEE